MRPRLGSNSAWAATTLLSPPRRMAMCAKAQLHQSIQKQRLAGGLILQGAASVWVFFLKRPSNDRHTWRPLTAIATYPSKAVVAPPGSHNSSSHVLSRGRPGGPPYTTAWAPQATNFYRARRAKRVWTRWRHAVHGSDRRPTRLRAAYYRRPGARAAITQPRVCSENVRVRSWVVILTSFLGRSRPQS